MTDYLSPEQITPTDAIIHGGLKPEDVKEAVLRLWLEPNDTWARAILVMYLRYGQKSDELKAYVWESALQSRIMSRIAHGIHRYDRYREPLLKFLSRDLAKARNDLYSAEIRLREEPRKPGPKPKPAIRASAPVSDEQCMKKAAKKLGVRLDQLCALLEDIKGGGKLSDDIELKYGIDSDKLYEYLEKNTSHGDSSYEPSDDIKTSALGDMTKKGSDASASYNKEGSLNPVSAAEKRFQDYLYWLNDEKAFGEWVYSPYRRRVTEDKETGEWVFYQGWKAEKKDNTRVIEMDPPPLQMSESEMQFAMERLHELREDIDIFREMIQKTPANDESDAEKPPSPAPPMPPLEDFATWYHKTKKSATARKQERMYLFIYQEYFLNGYRHNWRKLNEVYESMYQSEPPVSAQKALYRMKNEHIPEFLSCHNRNNQTG